MATLANKSFWLIDESTYGATPTTGTATRIRGTEALQVDGETAESEEVTPNRRAPYSRSAGRSVSGDIGSELRYGADIMMLLERQCCGTATAITMSASTLSVTASTRTITDSAAGIDTSKFRAGRVISITGFTTEGNNVTNAVISSVTSSTIVLTAATTTLADEAEGDSVTITSTTKRLLPGVTRKACSLIRDQSDITTGRYMTFHGVQLNDLNYEMAPKAFNKFTISCVGLDGDVSDSAPTGVTLGEATTYEPMNAIESTVSIDGTAVGSCTALKLTAPNGIAMTNVIGSAVGYTGGGIAGTTIENRKPTFTATVILDEDSAGYYTKFKNDTAIAFEIVNVDPAGNEIDIGWPNAKLTGAPTTGDTIRTMELAGNLNYSATLGSEYYIDFTPAV
jgi:hypothetical protein